MKKFLFTSLAFVLVASWCKKNDNPTVPTRTNLVTRIVSEAGTNDSLVRTYTYDVNNRVTMINQTANPYNSARVYSFSYNPDGSLAYADDNAFGRYRFTFDTNGKLIAKKTYGVSGTTETLRDTYIFSYSGNIVTRNYTPQSGNGFISKYTIATNGNLTALNEFNKSSPTDNVGTPDGTITYTNYDSKKNISTGFPSLFLFPENSVNNVGTITYPSFMISYTYMYNADGYVTRRVDNGGSISLCEYRRL